MDAQALVCDADGTVTLREVRLPDPDPSEVVVRTRYSGVSIGTERNLITGAVSWGPFPICPGYQAVGVVESAGDAVTAFTEGDRVYYRDNRGFALPDGTDVSATAGTHCSAAVVDPDTSQGIGHLPDGVDPAPASLFVMPTVGLNGANLAEPKMEDVVAVQGVGLIGLGAVAACHRRGAEVVAIDLDPDRLAVASAFGADHTVDASETDPRAAIEEVQSDGADVVFEATGDPALIDDALDLTRRDGSFVFQGDYGDRDVSFYFRTPHHNQLRAFFPVNDGLEPGRRAVLAQMETGVLPWERAITRRLDPDEAPALYDRMAEGRVADVLGATVDWTAAPA